MVISGEIWMGWALGSDIFDGVDDQRRTRIRDERRIVDMKTGTESGAQNQGEMRGSETRLVGIWLRTRTRCGGGGGTALAWHADGTVLGSVADVRRGEIHISSVYFRVSNTSVISFARFHHVLVDGYGYSR